MGQIDSIFFDSLKHIRKIPVIFDIFNFNTNQTIVEKNILLNRLISWESEMYNRIDLYISDGSAIADFEEMINTINKMNRQDGSIYRLSLTAYPRSKDKDTSMTFVITGDTIGFFSENETSTGDRVYTSLLEMPPFLRSGENIYDNTRYENLLEATEQTDEETLQYINQVLIEQTSPYYFPLNTQTIAETKQQNKAKKEEKSAKTPTGKKQNAIESFFFGPKKKEQTQTRVQQGVPDEKGEFINPKSLKIHEGSKNPEKELESIIGLGNIKKDIEKLKFMLEYEKNRKSRGIETNSEASLHMCFMGNPGTGKTTIARIMTGILYNMKYIKENKCIEVNGLDLKGGYVGQSAIITKQIIDKAKGGILFIDEAYALCESRDNSYGKEAVSVLLKEMEDNRDDLIVIFAGYEDDMDRFLNVNPGFRSRVNKYFDFVDYSTLELTQILVGMLKKIHLKINQEAIMDCVELFIEAKKHPNFSNGRFVRNLVEQMEEVHILNVTDYNDIERMDTVTIEDIPSTLKEKLLYGM